MSLSSLYKPAAIVLCAASMLFQLSACESEGPAERAGEKIDRAAEKGDNAVERAEDKVKDATR